MLKKSLVLAAAMIAGSSCIANAAPTKFVQFTVLCASGTTCSNDSEHVTRVDIEIVKKSNRVQQFIIPAILSEEERIGRAFWRLDYVGRILVLDAASAMVVNFRSSQDGQMAATCYAAF